MGTGLRGRPRTALSLAAAVVVIASCTSTPDKPPPPATPKVTSFTATSVNANAIALHWTTVGTGIDSVTLMRNGRYVRQLAGATSFEDDEVRPRRTYAYTIVLRRANGDTLATASATGTTPAPPPRARARLARTFDVTYTYVSENYINRKPGDRYDTTWQFVPRCDTGPCTVVVHTHQKGDRHPVLIRRGGSYEGSSTDLEYFCHHVALRENVTITIHVTRGRFVDGIWSVAAFTGTVQRHGPAALGCRAGVSTQKVAGRWVA